MRILADRHHADLFESYHLTLGDRYGWDVYAPIGMGWFDQGYWAFEKTYHGDAVARQYLEGVYPEPVDAGDHFTHADATHPGRTIRAVTIEQALSQPWDIVICSLPEWSEHLDGFHRVAQQTGAKLVGQVGNIGAVTRINWNLLDAVLISTTTHGFTVPVPHVVYHQEFSLADFRVEWPSEPDSVASFIQCFAENKHFYADFLSLARMEPDFAWKVYGAYGSHEPDEFAQGNLPSTPAVAEAMRRTRIAWHAKFWSDGYGHVIHNLYATGRPVFAYHNYYAAELAGPMMIHGQTGFDLSRMGLPEILDTLRRLRDDDDYWQEISANTAARFYEVVDFDADAAAVQALLESL